MSSSTAPLFKKYFPKDDYNFRNTDKKSTIEFLSLMGSVGTIAFSKTSDFDYWVCIREDLPQERLVLLYKKLHLIEEWSEKELGVEVHFFTMTGQSLRNNNFGEVSKESCGSAQAKLLKEEYYRSSLLVYGKTPVWYVAPTDLGDEGYGRATALIETSPQQFPEVYIDIGDLSGIPLGEFLGAGLWQLNKGIKSPYKSVMKLALILQYCDQKVSHHSWLAEELRLDIQKTGNIDEFDGYCRMMDRVLRHFEQHDSEDLETLRISFFIKIGISVSLWMDQKKEPSRYHDRIILKYVKEWGWSRRQVEDWEDVISLSVTKTLQLKRRIEMFMLRGLRDLFAMVGTDGLKGVMSDMDQTRLLNRLLSIYDSRRDRVEWCYPPFGFCLPSKSYTMIKTSKQACRLYRGEVNYRSVSSIDEKSFLCEDISVGKLVVWMIYNGLIQTKTKLLSNLVKADDFSRNIKSLAHAYRLHFGAPSIPSLDGTFARSPQPEAWIMAINMTPSNDHWLGTSSLKDEASLFQELFSRKKFYRGPKEAKINTSEGFINVPIQRIEGVLARLKIEPESVNPSSSVINPEETANITRIDDLEETVHEARVLLHPEDDVLNAWAQEHNLCRDILLLEKNSWGEVTVKNYLGEDGFMDYLLVVLQGCLDGSMSLSKAVCVEPGLAEYDTKRMTLRCRELLKELEDFFFIEEEPTRAECVSCFVISLGGRLFVITLANRRFSYQEFRHLPQATLKINRQHKGKVRYCFDAGNRRWNFYQEAVRSYKRGQVQFFAQKGTRASYFMIIDESGHVMISELPREELRSALPRFVYSLGLCLRKTQEVGLVPFHQTVSVYWFQRDEKNQPFMENITQKILKSVEVAIPRMAEVEIVLPWSTCSQFLDQYADHCRYRLDSDLAKNEIRYVTRELHKLRKATGAQRYYPVFLSEFQIVDENPDVLNQNTCFWMHLKTHLEKACLKYLDGSKVI